MFTLNKPLLVHFMLNSLSGVESGELVSQTYLDGRFSASLVLLQCKSCFESMRKKCVVALRCMAERRIQLC